MTIRNLTPHAINILSEDGAALATFPSEGIARATQVNVLDSEINGVPIVRTTFGATVDLPAPQEGVMLIVSVITANAAKAEGRDCGDLLLTCDPVRNDRGQVIGCRFLALYAQETPQPHHSVFLLKKQEWLEDGGYYGTETEPYEVILDAFATKAEAEAYLKANAWHPTYVDAWIEEK